MRSFVQASTIGVAVVAAMALASWVGVDPTVLTTTGPAVPAVAVAETIFLQVLENLTELLDRVADFLTQLNRVLSEFAQLFGEGGGDG